MAEIKFTDAEMRLFAVMVANLKGEMNTDWNKVAETLGYKSVQVAKSRFGNIVRAKIKGEQASSSDAGNRKAAKPAASTASSTSAAMGKSNIRKVDAPKHANGNGNAGMVNGKAVNGMGNWKVIKPRGESGVAKEKCGDEKTVAVKQEPGLEQEDGSMNEESLV